MIIEEHNTDNKVFIVAEIGNNHEGQFDVAMDLVRKAAESGADAVKFQTFIPERYVSAVFDPERIKTLQRFQLSIEEFTRLKEEAENLGMVFFSTPFDLESAKQLNNIQSIFKISSGDNNFTELVSLVAGFNKNLIISTGMCSTVEIDSVYKMVIKKWNDMTDVAVKPALAFMHCVSSYPVPPEMANLKAITAMKERYPNAVIGYSDHVPGINSCIVAVALGARIIEKHFTLDKYYSSFRDHQLSADPDEFTLMTEAIRDAENMLGNGEKVLQPCEQNLTIAARRSIAASKDMDKGHVIDASSITWVRPGSGIQCGHESEVIGKVLTKAVKDGQILETGDFE